MDITSPTELNQFRMKMLFANRYPELFETDEERTFAREIIPNWIDGKGRLTGKQPGKINFMYERALAYSRVKFMFDDEVETDFDDLLYVVVFCNGTKTWIKNEAGDGINEMIVPTETLRLVGRDGRPVLQPRPGDRRS